MGKASISIAVSGSYNGSAIERAQKSLDNLAVKAASSSDTLAKGMVESGARAAELGGEIYNLGSSVESTGQKMTAGLTAPIAAAGAGAIAAAMDFDKAGSTIDAACGGATESAESLKNVGRDLYTGGWGESMTQLSDALIKARGILGDISETDMSYAVEGAMTLEQAYGSDFSETLRGVNVLMDKFGLSAQEATDLMVAGTQRGLDYTQELGDNLSEYSGRWADAGMSASQYFSLLEAGAQNGAYQLDKVGDFLNEFLTSLTDGRMEEGIGAFSQGTQEAFASFQQGGATAQDVLNAVIGELAQMPDGYQRAQIASELWSSLGEDNAMSMITALANVDDSFTDVGGAAADAGAKISDNLENKATSAIRTAQSAVEPFASVAVDMLGQAADAAKGAADDFAQLDTGTQELIVGAAALAAAAGPVVTVAGKVTKGVGNVVTAFGKAKQEIATYADAMTTTNPRVLELYESNEKLSKALEKNPAAQAAGGVKEYLEAVKQANTATSDYNSSVRKLQDEQKKGSKANQELVANLEQEVAQRKAVKDAAQQTVSGYQQTAAAATTSSAAVTASSVAMKAAAVAGTALKAVLATCIPVAIITGIGMLVNYFTQAEEKSRTFSEATEGLVAATEKGASAANAGAGALDGYGDSAERAKADIDGMLESQAQLAQTIEETNQSASAQMAQLQEAYSTIQEYANQADLSTDAQNRLRAAVETVNSMCGTQIEVTDAANGVLSDENGAIQDVTGALGDYINKKMEQIQVDAQQQNLTALYEQQATDIAELTKAQADYNAKMAEHDQYIQDYINSYGQYVPNAEAAAEAAWEASLAQSGEAQAVKDAQAALDACNTSINNVSSSMTAQAAIASGSGASLQNLVLASSTVSTAMNAVGGDINQFSTDLQNAGVSVDTFRSLNDTQLAQLVASWDGTTDSIVAALDGMDIEMADAGTSATTALANALSSGSVSVESATAILQSAASGDWSSVASQMSSAGISLPQSVADGITSNSFVASGATSQMLSALALVLTGGDVKAAAQLLGHDIDAGLAQGIMNGTLSEQQASMLGQEVIDSAKTALQSHSPSLAMAQVGSDVDAGLAQGISGNTSGPLDAITQLGQSLIDAVSGLPGEMNNTGSQSSSNLAQGLAANTGSVSGSATGLYNAAASGVSPTPGTLGSTGTTAGANFSSGIASANGSTSSSATGLANAAQNGVSGTPGQLSSLGTSASSNFASGIGSGVGATSGNANQLANAAAQMQYAGNSYTWGSHLASNFASGIRAGLGWVSSAASAIANAARSVLGFSVPEDGPWSGSEKGGETSGLHLAQNFASGMTKGVGAVEAAAGKLGDASYFEANAPSRRGANIRTVSYGQQTARQGGTAALERKVDEMVALLREIAAKDASVYMDGQKVSSVIAQRARVSSAGRGVRM